MNLRQSLQFAVRGVLSNRMRSALTMSGIIIGVAAVIILVAAGTGASAAATSSISSLGSNTLRISSGTSAGTSGRTGGGGGGGGQFAGGAPGGGAALGGGAARAGGGVPGGGGVPLVGRRRRGPAAGGGQQHRDPGSTADPRGRPSARGPGARSERAVGGSCRVCDLGDRHIRWCVPHRRHVHRHIPELPPQQRRHGAGRRAVHRHRLHRAQPGGAGGDDRRHRSHRR